MLFKGTLESGRSRAAALATARVRRRRAFPQEESVQRIRGQ
jgi:hypothetical protein